MKNELCVPILHIKERAYFTRHLKPCWCLERMWCCLNTCRGSPPVRRIEPTSQLHVGCRVIEAHIVGLIDKPNTGQPRVRPLSCQANNHLLLFFITFKKINCWSSYYAYRWHYTINVLKPFVFITETSIKCVVLTTCVHRALFLFCCGCSLLHAADICKRNGDKGWTNLMIFELCLVA